MSLALAGSSRPLLQESVANRDVESELPTASGQEATGSLVVDVPSTSTTIEKSHADTVLNDEELAHQMAAQETRSHIILEGDRALARIIQQQEQTVERLAGVEIIAEPRRGANEANVDAQRPSAQSRRNTLKGWLSSVFRVVSSQHVVPPKNCVICQDPIRGAEIRVPCGHYYDKECIVNLFQAATHDETLFPPRCCRQPIPFMTVRQHMNTSLVHLFFEKSREFQTLKRVYCASPICSAFIGPQVEGWFSVKVYLCPKPNCRTSTCGSCKTEVESSSNHSCKSDEATQAVIALGESSGWSRCPGCSAMVELNKGCYHMTCRCKTEFCYLCRARWKTCRCTQWDEGRLVAAAEQRIDGLLAGVRRPAPVQARWRLPDPVDREVNLPNRAELVLAAVEDLRVNHDCQHLNWKYRDGGGRCDGCYDTLDRYVFHCLTCQTIACNRCRRNRF